MTALTLTKTETATEVPEFDRTDGDAIADEMLMESALLAKVGKVSGRFSRGRFGAPIQSAESRAWTKSGNVD